MGDEEIIDVNEGQNFKFAGEFETIIDPLTNDNVRVPKELVGLLGHIRTTERNATNKKAEAKYQPLLDELEQFKGDNAAISAKLQEIEDAELTAEQRLTKKHQAMIKSYEDTIKSEQDNTDVWRKKYEHKQILTDVFASFDTITQSLCNTEQTAELFIKEGNARAVEILNEDGEGSGVYETVLNLTIKEKDEDKQYEGTAHDLFPKWINQAKNKHHVASGSTSGGGTPITRGQRNNTNPEFENLNPVERIKIARRGQA